MRTLIETEKADMILHLGDHNTDAEVIAAEFPELSVHYVAGNCDTNASRADLEHTLDILGHKIIMTHGHLYDVKSGLDKLIAMGQREKADVLLFGHTHIPYYKMHGAMHVCNPGSISNVGKMSFATIQIEENMIKCQICEC